MDEQGNTENPVAPVATELVVETSAQEPVELIQEKKEAELAEEAKPESSVSSESSKASESKKSSKASESSKSSVSSKASESRKSSESSESDKPSDAKEEESAALPSGGEEDDEDEEEEEVPDLDPDIKERLEALILEAENTPVAVQQQEVKEPDATLVMDAPLNESLSSKNSHAALVDLVKADTAEMVRAAEEASRGRESEASVELKTHEKEKKDKKEKDDKKVKDDKKEKKEKKKKDKKKSSSSSSSSSSSDAATHSTKDDDYLLPSTRTDRSFRMNGHFSSATRHLISETSGSEDQFRLSSTAAASKRHELAAPRGGEYEKRHFPKLSDDELFEWDANQLHSDRSYGVKDSHDREPETRRFIDDYLGEDVNETTKSRSFLSGVETRTSDDRKLSDLQLQVNSLRQILRERDLDISSLRHQILQLQRENQEAKLRAKSSHVDESKSSLEQKVRDLERENRFLREDLRASRIEGKVRPLTTSTSALEYEPNSSYVMQKKIEELKGQMRDVEEANQTLSDDVRLADKRVKELESENMSLKAAATMEKEDMQNNHKDLRRQIDSLMEFRSRRTGEDDGVIRKELNGLKSDLRFLREHNDLLSSENRRLRQRIKDLQEQSSAQRTRFPSPVRQTTAENGFTDGRLKTTDLVGDYKTSAIDEIRTMREQIREITVSSRSPQKGEPPVLSARKTDYRSTSPLRTILKNSFEPISPKTDLLLDSSRSRYTTTIPHPPDTARSMIIPGSGSSTESILSDAENEIRRFDLSRSRTAPTERRQRQSRSPPRSAGLRTCTSPTIVTQHNRHLYQDLTNESLKEIMMRKRPFAPRTPAEVNNGDIVKFSRPGGKISKGIIKYVGPLPGRNDAYLGVELIDEDGKHDGTYNGTRFFKCKPNKGVFVSFNKIVMIWGDRF